MVARRPGECERDLALRAKEEWRSKVESSSEEEAGEEAATSAAPVTEPEKEEEKDEAKKEEEKEEPLPEQEPETEFATEKTEEGEKESEKEKEEEGLEEHTPSEPGDPDQAAGVAEDYSQELPSVLGDYYTRQKTELAAAGRFHHQGCAAGQRRHW